MEVQIGDIVEYNGFTTLPNGATVEAVNVGQVIGYDENTIYTDIKQSPQRIDNDKHPIWSEYININYGFFRIGFHRTRLIGFAKSYSKQLKLL